MQRTIYILMLAVLLATVSGLSAQGNGVSLELPEGAEALPEDDNILKQLPPDDPQLALNNAQREQMGKLLREARESTLGEIGATIPDFIDVEANPDKYTGQRLLIEGSLLAAEPIEMPLTPAWWLVQRWTIQTDDDVTVWVYLTDPRGVSLTEEKQEVSDAEDPHAPRSRLVEVGARVRLPGVFLTTIELDSGKRLVPVFAGKSPTSVDVSETAAAVPPLSSAQKTQLATARDRGGSVDEAAFYALLANAETWPSSSIGAIVPNLQMLMSNPNAWRGRLCLIEGTLKSIQPMTGLNRSEYQKTEMWVIVTDTDERAIVYLLNPPATEPGRMEGVPAESGSRVRVICRFYKTVELPLADGSTRLYPALVGNTAEWVIRRSGPQPATGADWKVMVVIMVVLFAFYYFVVRRLGGQKSKAVEILEMRRAARSATREDDDELDEPENLPEDPVGALETLNRVHQEKHPD